MKAIKNLLLTLTVVSIFIVVIMIMVVESLQFARPFALIALCSILTALLIEEEE